MSYPSVTAIAAERGVTLSTASPAELDAVLFEAFETDLPLGVAYLTEMATRVGASGERLLQPEDPGSPVGKQLVRLAGTDIARGVIERRLSIGLGLYNCCGVVMARTPNELRMTVLEQIKLQNGELATANC